MSDKVHQRVLQIKTAVQFTTLQNLLRSDRFGISKNKVEALELIEGSMKFKDIPVKKGDEYYVFDGPAAERDFCVYMQKIDKVFSIEDINTLSTIMGYDVFEYEPGPIMKEGGPGGPNCKHKWRRFRGKFIISGNVPSNRQIDALIRRSVFK
jgi:hypothetical protein